MGFAGWSAERTDRRWGVSPRPEGERLFGSDAMARLVEELEAAYDAVIIDAPPLNLVTDAALLGLHSDGVVLVAPDPTAP
jgi:protein-tyrosine kinase